MPRKKQISTALSPGQLASRWGVGLDRVRRLIAEGRLPGTFRIPSSGPYAETVRVPIETVVSVESEWAVGPPAESRSPKARRRRGGRSQPGALKHLQELNEMGESDKRQRDDRQRASDVKSA